VSFVVTEGMPKRGKGTFTRQKSRLGAQRTSVSTGPSGEKKFNNTKWGHLKLSEGADGTWASPSATDETSPTGTHGVRSLTTSRTFEGKKKGGQCAAGRGKSAA